LIELPESNKAATCNLLNLTGKYTNLEFSILIDFGNLFISQNIANVRCAKRVTLPPHSELGLGGKLVKNILF
jgi:hypothetical protein